ncbi:hypothetical protein CABS03_11522 [Colletotrichum abscissum]|uniref:Uncharacterized protein n=1 Tax=Colletotrichum abscissum TaxID=1671311 RepID=A0A9Q0AZR0_9PEZI|nr:hypothetical protein CABS02_11977 [Colletotrichum abscissum]
MTGSIPVGIFCLANRVADGRRISRLGRAKSVRLRNFE